jgi:L-fuconolactonase
LEVRMRIVDAQIHEPGPRLDWSRESRDVRSRLLTELVVGWMDAVGVDAAILHGIDDEWARQATLECPERLACVPQVFDPSTFDLDRALDRTRAGGNVVALRVVVVYPETGEGIERLRAGRYDEIFRRCEQQGMPVFLYVSGDIPLARQVVDRFPDLQIIIDHLGIRQPPSLPRDVPPFKALPDLLALAQHPNVNVKVSGAPSLSEEGFPFADLWPKLHAVIDAFGPRRLLWGSDATRLAGRIGFDIRSAGEGEYPGKHTYAESVHFLRDTFELSVATKEWLLGGTARRLLRWPT